MAQNMLPFLLSCAVLGVMAILAASSVSQRQISLPFSTTSISGVKPTACEFLNQGMVAATELSTAITLVAF